MTESYQEKQINIKKLFEECTSEEAKYTKIIQLGRNLPPLRPEQKNENSLVKGCQSSLYLISRWEEGKVYFEAESDALISAGLAALLLMAYSGETPETILKCPPDFLEELKITGSLTPNRANGLYSVHLRMKQDALKHLLLHP